MFQSVEKKSPKEKKSSKEKKSPQEKKSSKEQKSPKEKKSKKKNRTLLATPVSTVENSDPKLAS